MGLRSVPCHGLAADRDVHLQAWKNTVKRTLISELHRRVSRALSSMGLQHECEVVTDDGLFSVDIMLRDERIIVEVDGPSHYTYNSQQRLGEPCPLRWLAQDMALTYTCIASFVGCWACVQTLAASHVLMSAGTAVGQCALYAAGFVRELMTLGVCWLS